MTQDSICCYLCRKQLSGGLDDVQFAILQQTHDNKLFISTNWGSDLYLHRVDLCLVCYSKLPYYEDDIQCKVDWIKGGF